MVLNQLTHTSIVWDAVHRVHLISTPINIKLNLRKMKNLISRLTMKRIGYNFTDKVSGRGVYDYVDKYGQEYMANYPFFVFGFRVKKN